MKLSTALLLATTMPLAGCGWFGIGGPNSGTSKVPVVKTTADGNRIIAIDNFGLQLREPSDIQLKINNVGENFTVMYWSGPVRPGRMRAQHRIQIDTKARYMHDDLEAMKTEYNATYTSFRKGEEHTLENGFDLYYSYWDDGARRIGYQAEVTLGGTQYRCFASGQVTIPVMKAVREMCRSLTLLEEAPAPAAP